MTDLPHVQPQDAFAELAKISLADHSLDHVMAKVATLAKSTLGLNGEVSVTIVDRGKPATIASTGSLATELDERQYARGYGPCLDCIAGGEPLMVKDMDADQRWPDWAQSASSAGAGSSLSIPVPIQREVSAALNIYSTDRDAFDADAVELASTFAAKGILMGQRRCGPQEAFDLLVLLSQSSNRKLRDVAEALVAQAESGDS
jgi:transcriptional regulator with GAF, ATPase, and Fis domain